MNPRLRLSKNFFPPILQVMIGDKVQRFFGLLKIPVECPENLLQTHFLGRRMLGGEFIEFLTLFRRV
jgi:hypothetical protein